MRRIAGMAALAAACVAAPGFAGEADKDAVVVAAPAMEEVLTMRVDGEITVDATGKVVGHALKTELQPKLRELIDKAMLTWVFFPPVVNGKPTAVKSDMRITLLGKKAGDGYDVTIDNVLFSRADFRDWSVPKRGEKEKKNSARTTADGVSLSIKTMKPRPRYPQHWNVNGIVTILVNIAPDGRIIDAVSTQCSLYFAGGTPIQRQRACRTLEDSAASAIKQWTVTIDGHGKPVAPIARSGTVPLHYVMVGPHAEAIEKASQPGNWRLESRTPYRLPAWARGDRFAQRMGTSYSVGSGELMSTESALRLRDGQAGTVL
jgi:hypothetical protein